MKIIGLTGAIASGKSTVSNYLCRKGCHIIDADLISRQIVNVGMPVYKALRAYFGEGYFTQEGELNRKKLGDYVFSNSEALLALNGLTHPVIVEEIKKVLEFFSCSSPNGWVILDAALFFDLQLEELVDEVWYIETTSLQQKEWLKKRNQLTDQEAQDRIETQAKSLRNKQRSKVIIENYTTIERLYQQIDQLLDQRGYKEER